MKNYFIQPYITLYNLIKPYIILYNLIQPYITLYNIYKTDHTTVCYHI